LGEIEDSLGGNVPQLAVPRRGWENEHLATFLLTQISFVAHPITVADDIGSDFFCTLFETKEQNGIDLLFPLNSLAIQIKSNRDKVPATNKIDYLSGLEIPFFLGVIDRSGQRLAFYSGEQLPILFSHLGRPSELTLVPVDSSGVPQSAQLYYDGTPGGPCSLRLPFVVELAADDERKDLEEKGRTLVRLCTRIHSNISARANREYIFRLDSSGQARILAGPGSAQTFRANFQLRLAEAFYNLEWLLQNRPAEFSTLEFDMYERVYEDIRRQGLGFAIDLPTIYERVKALIGVVEGASPNSCMQPPAGSD
jgi:hypothetical protein